MPSYLGNALRDLMTMKPTNSEFKMIDLFAGIGGTRLGFETVGGNCVFTSEWDKYAQQKPIPPISKILVIIFLLEI